MPFPKLVERVDLMVIMTSIGEISKDSILLHESVIRGYCIFKVIWTSQLGEILLVSQEAGNAHEQTCSCFAYSRQNGSECLIQVLFMINAHRRRLALSCVALPCLRFVNQMPIQSFLDA